MHNYKIWFYQNLLWVENELQMEIINAKNLQHAIDKFSYLNPTYYEIVAIQQDKFDSCKMEPVDAVMHELKKMDSRNRYE